MNTHCLKRLLALASLVCASCLPAAVLTVDNNPGAVAMFDNFPDAYDAASDGDTILLAGSMNGYGGSYTIYKRLNIVGPGYFLSQNGVPGLSNQNARISVSFDQDSILGTSSGSKIMGVEANIDVGYEVSGIVIERCYRMSSTWNISSATVIRSCVDADLAFQSGSEGSILTNSILRSVTFFTVNISIDRCVLTSSFFGNQSTSVSNTIFVFSSASSFTRNNASVSNCMAVGFSTLPAGGGNINGQLIGNVFVNTGATDAKYQLKAGSPAIGAGTSGSNMGAFGGPNPYVLSGLPDMPRLTRLVVPATATSTTGLQFEVDAQAFPQ